MSERMKELTTYLETLAKVQTSGYKCNGEIAKALGELESLLAVNKKTDLHALYLRSLIDKIDGVFREDFMLVNEQILALYQRAVNGNFYVERATGTSTSILALQAIVPDVVYLQYGNSDCLKEDVTNKVVFVDSGVELSRGLRPKAVINIRSVDFIGDTFDYNKGHLRKANVAL